MPTRAEVETYRQANASVATLAYAEVAALWATLNLSNAAAASVTLQETLPDLLRAYGDMAAALAADFYDSLRERSAARREFASVLAEAVPDAQVQSAVRWSLSPIFDANPDPDAALSRIEGVVQRETLQAGRDTISQNVDRDPDASTRWARIPTGAETCAFCLVMASRGAEYRSFESAGARKLPDGSNPHAYHADCDCVAAPFWDGDQYPDGYDPDALLDIYDDAASAADGGKLKSVLSKMREQRSIH